MNHTPNTTSNIRPDIQVMTVGRLREILAHIDADSHILIADTSGEYFNVSLVRDDSADLFSVVLQAADNFDPRQY